MESSVKDKGVNGTYNKRHTVDGENIQVQKTHSYNGVTESKRFKAITFIHILERDSWRKI